VALPHFLFLFLIFLLFNCSKKVETGSEKPVFVKKAQPAGFLSFIGFWALLDFSDFLFE